MTRILLSVFLLLGTASFADHPDHVEAKGKVVYKEGKSIQHSDVSLFVPKMGKGKIIAAFNGKEVESDWFKAAHINGRTMLYVQFSNIPDAPKGAKALLQGSYMRGDNEAVYHGEFFLKAAKKACDCGGSCGGSCGCDDCDCEGCDCDQTCGCDDKSCDDQGCGGCGKHKHGKGKKHKHAKSPWTYKGGFYFSTPIAAPALK